MKNLVCKLCGNDQFNIRTPDRVMCKCGLVLKINNDKLDAAQEQVVKASQKLKAEIILRVSLLNREIDKCLDNKNKERFKNLTTELKHYHEILNTEIHLMEKYTYLKKKFNSIAN